MGQISTHILDTSRGLPAAGLTVSLEFRSGDGWKPAGKATTDLEGRIRSLAHEPVIAGTYRINFATGAYFASLHPECFYPEVQVQFEIRKPAENHHVPLLLSPFGYSTYKGV